MSLQKLELVGLRGFVTLQELAFAVPNGSPGSGLTTLVGPNNGGKSTIVEALRALAAPSPQAPSQPTSFTEGRRNKRAGDRATVQTTDINGDVGSLRTIAVGGSETEWFPSTVAKKMFVLPSRRYFNPYFGKSMVTRDSYAMNYLGSSRSSTSVSRTAASIRRPTRNLSRKENQCRSPRR